MTVAASALVLVRMLLLTVISLVEGFTGGI